VALGGGHSCARTKDRSLWCWGDNYNGQLGDGTTEPKSSPVEVPLCPWEAPGEAGHALSPPRCRLPYQ
jgi:alpha-tubulin suppressor-like RCC1 family protein